MTTWTAVCVTCAARDRVTPLEAGHVCPACGGWMRRTLTDISRLVAEAAVAGDRQRVGSSTGKPVFGSRPPLDVECLDPDLALVRLTDHPPWPTLLEVLEGWERLTREARHLSPYGPASEARGGGSVHGCVGFLLASADWIVATPDFPVEDYAGELRACLRAVRKWDGDAGQTSYGVECPADRGDTICGYRMTLTGQDVDDAVSCRRCGATWSVGWLMRVAATSTDAHMWIDGDTVCHRFGVNRTTLARWVREGRIAKQHNMYDAKPLIETATRAG